MKHLIILTAAFTLFTNTTFAKKADDKEALTKKMVTACKADLAKDPVLTDTRDSEAVFKNLEEKENSGVKLSKNCNAAHEKYEKKFHKEEESKETEEK